jgi:hypothetical protein
MTWTSLVLACDDVVAAEAAVDRPAIASATIAADVITVRRRCLARVMKLVFPRIWVPFKGSVLPAAPISRPLVRSVQSWSVPPRTRTCGSGLIEKSRPDMTIPDHGTRHGKWDNSKKQRNHPNGKTQRSSASS